ncbi:hypothetical protein K492DRAFT_177677 [Lichtheimia hyalospora FSU 10163]|nr:hypothetical protein K492DRAFT_177677 [Lichtheimia hyalospora FSU 10163]
MTANSSTTTTNNHAVAPADKHRRKRLKVVSACLECRRKKTKCNGETPCAGCIKAKVDCKYVSTLQQQHVSRSRSTAAPVARHQQQHPSHQQNTAATPSAAATSTPGSNNTSSQANRATVNAIEQRLCVIEDILRALLKDRAAANAAAAASSTTTSTQGYFTHSHPSLQSSYTASVHHASHVHNWYPTRDWVYTSSPSSSSSTFSSTSPAAPPSSAFHLPPLRQQHPPPPSSSAQPSTTSIRSLLNNNDDLPTPPPTATFFEKEASVSIGTRHYAEYYMTP